MELKNKALFKESCFDEGLTITNFDTGNFFDVWNGGYPPKS